MTKQDISMPNIDESVLDMPSIAKMNINISAHKPKILLLYGSLRERSFSRLAIEESARLLTAFGAETRIFDPKGLPQPDTEDEAHPKVKELRELMVWSEGQVWCSPERHGAMTGILKSQIDWVPLNIGGVRPTQGKTLAIMQVCGGSQSDAGIRAMEENVHYSQSILSCESLFRV